MNLASGIETRALRILIVDDNVDAAQSLAMLLEASGHHVHTAYDGQAATGFASNCGLISPAERTHLGLTSTTAEA